MNDWNNLYGSKKWFQYREHKLNESPFCSVCNSTFDLHIDHIFDHKGNLSLFYEYRNLQVLCREHHTSKTVLDIDISKLSIGDWTLNVKIEPNNQIETYSRLYGDDKLRVYKRIINETKTNPYQVDLSVDFDWDYGDKKYLICLLIQKMKSKPKKINIDETFFPDWFLNNLFKMTGGISKKP